MTDSNLKEEFISTVSHELRTPLTSIRGFSQTLLNSWDKIDEDNKKKFIKIIEEQSNRLISLVENILAVSKINSNEPMMKEVDVNFLIEKVVQIILQKYKDYKIILNFNKVLPPVMLDEDKFQQIMTNLLDNACKYSTEKKEVLIETTFADAEKVRIIIKDYGIGIEQQDLCKIFEKFVRLENHLTSKTQGNGLGLYITKSLVESMSGNITVSSVLNEGTQFQIEFPFYNAEEALKCSLQS